MEPPTLLELALRAIAQHIFCFYNSALLDEGSLPDAFQHLLHRFDVAHAQGLRDGDYLHDIFKHHLTGLGTAKPLATVYAQLLWGHKHAWTPREIEYFGLSGLVAADLGTSMDPDHTPATTTIDDESAVTEVDQTFASSRRVLEIPPTDPTVAIQNLTVVTKCLEPLTNAFAHALADILLRYDRLVEVRLVSCLLGPAGVVLLAASAATSTSLRVLDLSNDWTEHDASCDNVVGSHGAIAVATAISTSPSLTKVALNGTRLGYKGGRALAAAIAHSRSLRCLHLRRCKSVARAAAALLAAYDASHSLVDLDMEWCRLPAGLGVQLFDLRVQRQAVAPEAATTTK
ncbi:hypothetical protein SPRG_01934 [Saprolegnia parasitica CBS 223.65]|uniref:Uncharacterized protein n=1 Tax=Saprolegnia parasitica (strain CBS 223.65) TaxID=695850 RepID=A0A067D288_SAPPC|nr:hypothetical protein SPRG_01934 [Saprolegnia parasitica CBS 223.65]KDO33122.1 hypothetical protein SPRG_01934 [Saprolegnia parasitica CBS 223.65]|eukprot:XP_012195889.1 hypothetical protein SPRG_01934 [Saprolegnia parasitica CBS 223.65]